jgi:adenosylhomocysteine nucleosidase
MSGNACAVILVSADAEWQVVRDIISGETMESSPYGEWFPYRDGNVDLIFFHGGWGKIAAAGSTQFAIDQWHPDLLINLGTCGGFAGKIDRNTIVLVDRTIVYDIYEQMGDLDSHIAWYTTNLDLSWLGEPFPLLVKKCLLVSGDRDLDPKEISRLAQQYGAVAGDWESGAIAYVAARNNKRCLILRGVSDLVDDRGGDAYGDLDFFARAARVIMQGLVNSLPGWLQCAGLLEPKPRDLNEPSHRSLGEK